MNRTVITLLLSTILIGCSSEKRKGTYFSGDKLRSQVAMINGRQNGILKEYYSDGRLQSEVSIVDDFNNGEGVIYYPNGVVARRSNFVQGVLVGEDRGYFYDGKLKFSSVYDSSGNLIDFAAFGPTGERDFSQLKPVVYIERRRDGRAILTARLANADPRRYKEGKLIIISSFRENGMASDTLYSQISNNIEGFTYLMPAENEMDTIRGFLVFSFPSDTATTEDIFGFKYRTKQTSKNQ